MSLHTHWLSHCCFDFLQSGQAGTYTLRQLCATVGEVQFVLSHIYPSVRYEVYSQEPQLTVEPLSGQQEKPASNRSMKNKVFQNILKQVLLNFFQIDLICWFISSIKNNEIMQKKGQRFMLMQQIEPIVCREHHMKEVN